MRKSSCMKWTASVARIRRSSERDAAVIGMLVYYGLKPNEVLKLKHEHIDWKKKAVVIGERRLPLHPDVKVIRGLWRNESTWVFEGRKNRPLSARQLQLITRKWMGKSPTELRREFAKDFIRNGGTLPELMSRLGHAHISTTAQLLS